MTDIEIAQIWAQADDTSDEAGAIKFARSIEAHITTEIVRAAFKASGESAQSATLTVCADGGKGEAVYQRLTDMGWAETTREGYASWEGVKRILYIAPQAECTAREARRIEREDPFDDAPRADDLRALVVRLARALLKAAPDNDLSEKALDYLKREGLIGSPLRATDDRGVMILPPSAFGELPRADADTEGAKPVAYIQDDDLEDLENGCGVIATPFRRHDSDIALFSPRPAAGASERADAEKDAALMDEQIIKVAAHCFGMHYADISEYSWIKFARAILAANKAL